MLSNFVLSEDPLNLTGASSEDYTFYVLVRTDMPLAQQLVQATHASAEAARLFYEAHHGISRAVLLRVKDSAALSRAQTRLTREGVLFTTFFEPDFGIGYSALATAPLPPGSRSVFRHWQLWEAPVELRNVPLKGGSA